MSDITIKPISRLDDFRGLKEPWQRLVERMDAPTPFVTHEWLCVWWEGWAGGAPATILTGWHNGELVGALPLTRDRYTAGRIFKFRSLQSMTCTESPASGILCEPARLGGFLAAIQKYLAGHPDDWDLVFLQRLQAGTDTLTEIKKVFDAGDTAVLVRPYPGSYLLEIGGDFEDCFCGLSKAFVKDRKYKNNKLARLGEVGFSMNDCSADAMEKFYRMENSGWKKRSSILALERQKPFYDKMAGSFAADRRLSLATLTLDGRPIASILGLIDRQTFHFLKIALDYDAGEKTHKTSPGQALLFHLIRHCFERKLKWFDFCGPFYEYERMWTNRINQKHNVLLLNRKKSRVRLYLRLRRIFKR